MTLPIIGTAAVENGSPTFVFTGAPLSPLNCVPGTSVVLDGVVYFVLTTPTDTMTGTLTRNYAGEDDAAVVCEISQITADGVSTATLNKRTADLLERIEAIDANGPGAYYLFIGATGATDPGANYLAFNSDDPASVTTFYLNAIDANNSATIAAIQEDDLLANTTLIFRSINDPANFIIGRLTAPLTSHDGATWYSGIIDQSGHSGTLAVDEAITMEWHTKGDQGASFVSDAQTDDIAGRAACDDEAAGFVVLVNDTGDGRAAYYTMGSGGSADWGTPAYLTGPRGDTGDVTVTDVLDELGIHAITISTDNPSGGQDGDLWFRVTE